ncbi:hypothetical protein D9758_001354 [Tetrapyrgos nigripes]|uniref:Uncharacterized protein n=1 Tax=Tetrapyrgos nigripes TaxID=182062 RepID=A0A8H5GRT8_9AGAR|nr:hypothetical protein D9758_001354 [Tetrapyrgos nigripes]
MSITPTADEVALAERILSAQKKQDVLDPDAAVEIFTSSTNLSAQVLAEVWNLADEGSKGYLCAKDVASALRLIGWAQAGESVSRELLERDGPLAIIKGFSPENSKSATIHANSQIYSPVSPVDSKSGWNTTSPQIYPPISPVGREKYRAIFQSAGPQNGVLDNIKVVDVWTKSGLSTKVLSQIWDLVNVNQQGYLGFGEFCVGMFLIQGLLDKLFAALPNILPPHLSIELKGKGVSTPTPAAPAFPTPMVFLPNQSLLGELEMKHWVLDSSFRTYASGHFERLDALRQGFIEGDAFVTFLQSSGLSNQELSRIWDLVDLSRTGKISQDGFTIALFLLHRKLAGFDIPNVLPPLSSSTLPLSSTSLPSLSPLPPSASPLSPSPNASFSHPDPLFDKPLPPIEDSPLSRSLTIPGPTKDGRISTLERAATTMRHENDALRSSLKSMSQTLERQKTLNASRRYSSLDNDVAEISRLKAELTSRDSLVSRLRDSLKASENLGQENALLRVETERLASQLEVAKADHQVQQILAEEASHECEELRRQVRELRESTSLPSTGGDEELQMLINEDISRENGRLRNQIKELQDSIAQLQELSTELDARKESERTLVSENRQLKRRLRESEEASSARSTVQARMEELSGENGRLRRELQRAQENAERLARRPVRQESNDVPPPSYSEVTR